MNSRTRWTPAWMLTGFFFAALLATPAEAQTLLRWKWAPGQVLNHTMTQESKINVVVQGQSLDTTSSLVVETVWNVNKVDAQGTAAISQTIPRVRMKMMSPQGGVDVDTASPTEPTDFFGKQMSGSLKALTKSKVSFDMSATGEVANVAVMGEDGKPATGGDPFSQMLGKDGIISMVKQTMHPLPKEPLQKGSSWANKVEMEVPALGGKVAADTQLTYHGPTQVNGKPLERIQMDTKTSVAQQGTGNPLQMSIKEQSDKGTLFFDNTAGRFSHAESVQTLTMQVILGTQTFDQKVSTTRKSVLTPATK